VSVEGKLRRAERKVRKLHGLQARVRSQLEDLEKQRKQGMDAAKHAAKRAKLEQKRHEILEKLKAIEAEERQLRAQA
jgi:hypothetical protein